MHQYQSFMVNCRIYLWRSFRMLDCLYNFL